MARVKFTLEDWQYLLAGWQMALPRLPDSERSFQQLYKILTDSQSCWFYGPMKGSFIYLRDVNLGEYAGFHALNVNGESAIQDPGQAKEIIAAIMDELQLVRLYSLIPIPAFRVLKATKKLGFKQEGRLRKAVRFNGDFTDLAVMGLLRYEVN